MSQFFRAYVFILNGIGIYTTWTVIASLLNLGHALRYVSEVSMKDTSNVSLSLLLVLSVVYFLFENTTLDKKLRFLFTPYLGEKYILSVGLWRFFPRVIKLQQKYHGVRVSILYSRVSKNYDFIEIRFNRKLSFNTTKLL